MGDAAAAESAAGGESSDRRPPFVECEATYGTPIEAPSSEAMMTGREAMARRVRGAVGRRTGGEFDWWSLPLSYFDVEGAPAWLPDRSDGL